MNVDTPSIKQRINPDVLIAIFLLAVCGVLWVASFEIREPDYGQLSPATWPRIIIVVLAFLSLIYLVQSIRSAGSLPVSPETTSDDHATAESRATPGIAGFYHHWKNVFWCFALYGLYLYSLPWLGMLVGALSFVFLLLCALGGWHPRKLLLHAAIALLTVGGMWSLFTFGLDVLLPTGSLFEGR